MQNIYREVYSLDKRLLEHFHIPSTIMMEHAALSIFNIIDEKFEKNSRVLIVCGGGDNGADGIALARLLYKKYNITLYLASEPKSELAKKQYDILDSIGIYHSAISGEYDIIVDALFGAGLNRELDENYRELIDRLNAMSGYKIAVDIPSGIFSSAKVGSSVFCADLTVTMGGYKLALFSDYAKDFTGEIIKAELGVDSGIYEIDSDIKLLEFSDLKLPYRKRENSHKGSYGHLVVVAGEKNGAAVIAAMAGFRFGAGLVSILGDGEVPYELMRCESLPSNTTAIAIGMGLGSEYDESLLTDTNIALVLDADILYHSSITSLLDRDNIVLTPHPKEFVNLLRITNLADIDVATLQADRFGYSELFCTHFPKAVLVLKGANVIIASDKKLFINPLGGANLAKGGSGDVLSGLIASLLAQGYSPLDSAINGSLAHTIASAKIERNSYGLSPFDIIDMVSKI